MYLRVFGEALLGAGLSVVDLRTAERVEKKLAGGKAMSVRSMIARQMLMALVHRRMKQLKQARS